MSIVTGRRGNPIPHFSSRIFILITALLVIATLFGCSSSLGVSSQKDLAGVRSKSADSYSGKYTANYHGFTGMETLFGGTGKHATIRVTGHITNIRGTGLVLVTNGADMKRRLPMQNGNFDQTYTLDGSSFYIYTSGDNFTGSIALTSKEE